MEKSITAQAGSQNKVRPEARERPNGAVQLVDGEREYGNWQAPSPLNADIHQP
jgi:hypothetical protein